MMACPSSRVQQTAGSLRDLQAFSLLQAYTAPKQFSHQPQLTQTVGQPLHEFQKLLSL